MFAMATRALCSEICGPAVIMCSVSVPPCVYLVACLLHQLVGRGQDGGMGGGRGGMVERDGKRRKSWKEEEME